jgi:hypothetical protein
MSSLSELVLFDVSFIGALPSSIGLLSNLQLLYIEYTSLQGTLLPASDA